MSVVAQASAGALLPDPPTAAELDRWFVVSPVSDAVFARMRRGGSFPDACTVQRADLRYLRVLHYNFDGRVQVGEIVCNKLIASDLIEIFKALFQQKYEIRKILLIDEYAANDEASMADDNTSCFCFRPVKGSAKLSKHSQGLAIDINPLENPCVKFAPDGEILSIEPDTPVARRHAVNRIPANRSDSSAGQSGSTEHDASGASSHTITRGDALTRLFTAHSFTWGGAWRTKKDFQHFEK